MSRDRFAVLSVNGRSREEVLTAASLRELAEKAVELGQGTGDKFVAVRYQRSGNIKIASSGSLTELGKKVWTKSGVR